MYTNDGMNWIYYNHGLEFIGNSDLSTIVTHEFSTPFKARAVRICPTDWNNHISMRVEVYFRD